MGILAELSVHDPGQHLRHLHRHLAAFRQLALRHQRVHVAHPVQLRRQEVRDVEAVALRGAPLVFKRLGQLRQGQLLARRRSCCDGLRQRRPQVQAPGAGSQKAGAVRGVLHRVRERDELLVLVEATAEQLAHHHRRQAGGLRAHDGQRPVPPAIRAVMVRLGELGAIACGFLQVGRDVHGQQRLVPAVRTTALRHLVQGAALWAHLLAFKYAPVSGRRCRKQEARRYVFAEERVVEDAQVLLQLVRAGLGQRCAPAGCVAVTAVDHRQMLMILVGLAQVVVVPQHRLRIHLGHHAPKFALPDLHLHLQKEVLMPRLPGMGH